MDVDRTDFEILRHLRNDARLSNKRLAARLNIAPSTCLMRVRRLIGEGVLKGFHADVDSASLGVGLQAMVSVRLSKHAQSRIESIRQHMQDLPEVVQFYHVAGRTDFLVQVWARDSEHLRELLMSRFAGRDEVDRIESSLIFEHAISTSLPQYVAQDEDSDP